MTGDNRLRLPLPRGGPTLVKPAGDNAAGAVVTPDYGDDLLTPATPSRASKAGGLTSSAPKSIGRRTKASFNAYGDRSWSRPYALRLPQPIDLVLRQIAAEHHTQPLRIVDQALHDYLAKLGRLPPTSDA